MKPLEERMRDFGTRTALKLGPRTVTYHELLKAANARAQTFRDGQVERLAVDLPRGKALVETVMACYLAEIPYVLSSPEWTIERRATIADQIAATHILDGDGLRRRNQSTEGTHLRGTAYFATSSGSSGAIKCVAVSSRGLLALMQNQSAAFGLAPGERILQFANPGYDAIVSEIYTSLWAGAELVLAEVNDVRILLEARALIAEGRIDTVTLTPSLATALGAEVLSPLRKLILAGEAPSADLIRQLAAIPMIFNAYGPCEATCCTHVNVITTPADATCIGRPLEHVRCKLIDGELVILGDAVGLGYVGRSGSGGFRTTAEGPAFYTGDLFEERADGLLNYVGRRDDQLKIRGKKVSASNLLLEISDLPGVATCQIVVHEGCLGVFYTGRATLEDVRLKAAGRAEVILMDELPLNENGKVDRRALIQRLRSVVEAPSAPVNNLAALWNSILGTQGTPDPSDDFFRAGGDSLGIVTLISDAETLVGHPLDFEAFLNAPTFGQLTALAAGMRTPRDRVRNEYLDRISTWDAHVSDGQPNGDILLTGATGNVGGEILKRLLSQTAGRIWCLTRGRVDLSSSDPRVRWISCDLETESSTDQAIRTILSTAKIRAVVHCAAKVNHVYTYENLFEANVGATYRLLRFAKEHAVQNFVFIGTMSSVTDGRADASGYDLSKGEAEKLVEVARRKGLNATTIRLPLVYAANVRDRTKDHFLNRIDECVQRRIRPAVDGHIFAVDAEDCAAAVAQLVRPGLILQAKYDLVVDEGVSWLDVFEKVLKLDLQTVPYEEWRRAVLAGDGPLAAFRSLYRDEGVFAHRMLPDLPRCPDAISASRKLLADYGLTFKDSKEVLARTLKASAV